MNKEMIMERPLSNKELKEAINQYLKTNPSKNEIQEFCKKLKNKSQIYTNMEQGIKIGILNSIYGAFGSPFFRFFDRNIATSITAQAKDVILYAEKVINAYFKQKFHVDYSLHKELGIEVLNPLKEDVVRYIDTDSVFLSFEELWNNIKGWDKTLEEFILAFDKKRLKSFIDAAHEKYTKDQNYDNWLDLELEYIANKGLFMTKKKYFMDITYKDGRFSSPLSNPIYTKGFDTIQGKTPLFAREKLNELVKFILSKNSKDLNMKELVRKLKEYKKEYQYCSIDELAETLKVNKYEVYISQDSKSVVFNKGAGPNHKGAGIYNFLLYNSEHKNKYESIRSGEKIKLYSSQDPKIEFFAYKPGKFPREFAPPANRDKMFAKTIIEPVNKILTSINMPNLSPSLMYSASLF